jgi:hypothetical protein
MKKADKEYYKGFGYAMATINRHSMKPQVVKDCMNSTGITIEELKQAGCDESDIEEIEEALSH